MISYSDRLVGTARAGEPWASSGLQLEDRLHAIAVARGDQPHTSGRVDYLVRIAENHAGRTVSEAVDHWFLVRINPDGIEIIEQAASDDTPAAASISYDGDWLSEIEGSFARFRERIEA